MFLAKRRVTWVALAAASAVALLGVGITTAHAEDGPKQVFKHKESEYWSKLDESCQKEGYDEAIIFASETRTENGYVIGTYLCRDWGDA